VRIVAVQQPGSDALAVTPTIEDAYLHCITSQRARVAA